MRINISKAVKQFFPNPSLDMVYYEAIANCLDAGATEIKVEIYIKSFDHPETLKIIITDNGNGFTDRGFSRFGELLVTDSPENKGLGRLVFLNYFKQSIYDSRSNEGKKSFILNNEFDGNFKETTSLFHNGTILTLVDYYLNSIKTYDYLRAETLANSIELHFLPRLFLINKIGSKVAIELKVNVDEPNNEKHFYSDTKLISSDNLPHLKSKIFKIDFTTLFDEFEILYKVEQDIENTNLIIALNADNRTIAITDIISKENIPQGYNCIFLIQSEYFEGKVGNSRQKLEIDQNDFNAIKYGIIAQIKEILEQEIPQIVERNKREKEYLERKYPHLSGYFNEHVAGLVDKSKLLEKAQQNFFLDQKMTLEASHLDDNLYQKSLEVSSRVLTEYILYRNLIIDRLKMTNPNNSEADIHNMIVPMREKFKSKKSFNDLYRNNAWLLDDKFMSYSTILSDLELNKLIKELKVEEELTKDKDTRPDLSIIFNGNPNQNQVDVVIVELKKRKAGLHENEKILGQIKRRARRLLEYYPTKIQRMWFYGIVDIDGEFELSLADDEYTEIFSVGKAFYKTQEINYEFDGTRVKCPIGITILSYKAFLDDAEKRNETFLNVLKHSIKEQNEK